MRPVHRKPSGHAGLRRGPFSPGFARSPALAALQAGGHRFDPGTLHYRNCPQFGSSRILRQRSEGGCGTVDGTPLYRIGKRARFGAKRGTSPVTRRSSWVDGREPASEAATAEWCARRLDELADLPPSSNVRVLVEQFAEDITRRPSASPERASTPSGGSRWSASPTDPRGPTTPERLAVGAARRDDRPAASGRRARSGRARRAGPV